MNCSFAFFFILFSFKPSLFPFPLEILSYPNNPTSPDFLLYLSSYINTSFKYRHFSECWYAFALICSASLPYPLPPFFFLSVHWQYHTSFIMVHKACMYLKNFCFLFLYLLLFSIWVFCSLFCVLSLYLFPYSFSPSSFSFSSISSCSRQSNLRTK